MEEKATVAVRYVGNKPQAFGGVAHAGKVWNGHGDVQNVTPAQAAVLLAYPDQWAKADASQPVPKRQPNHGATGLGAPRLDTMTRPDLQRLARDQYNVTLPNKMTRKEMVDRIEELQAGPPPIVTVPSADADADVGAAPPADADAQVPTPAAAAEAK